MKTILSYVFFQTVITQSKQIGYNTHLTNRFILHSDGSFTVSYLAFRADRLPAPVSVFATAMQHISVSTSAQKILCMYAHTHT